MAGAQTGARHRSWKGTPENPLAGKHSPMNTAAEIVLGVLVFLSAALVLALFVWAAIKDGAEDRALQARLGTRRRTRLGR